MIQYDFKKCYLEKTKKLKNKDLFFNLKKLKYPTNVFTALFFNIIIN